MAAGAAVAAELVTGTFYLLMLALGLAAGALAAHVGAPLTAQLIAAALVGGGAVAGWHLAARRAAHRTAPPTANRDVNLDIGERVHVDAWNRDGTARVNYRGANWTARLAAGRHRRPGPALVAAVEGKARADRSRRRTNPKT